MPERANIEIDNFLRNLLRSCDSMVEDIMNFESASRSKSTDRISTGNVKKTWMIYYLCNGCGYLLMKKVFFFILTSTEIELRNF